ncbi:hypothetical protein GQ42DRAFT_106991, partial [Ramicandelaber brevisporus]
EREFLNMFHLAPGFEVASFKPAQQDADDTTAGKEQRDRDYRKISIGFARFRTKIEAIHARDALNGKVIDSESGHTLKVELAKKNLRIGRNATAGGNVNATAMAPTPSIVSNMTPSPFQPTNMIQTRSMNVNDQNPPCNTLYVGNLAQDTQEDELRGIFTKAPGFRRLVFRPKPNTGPMCFVEFESVYFATQALRNLDDHMLSNSKSQGVRLSYSKNPL